ncbi:AAA family ATPase [Corynebacterium pseudodiphtheriticum]|uniref:ATP-binding protein n=1 Tax=Corynebacterium pseudodiphtheriticum TaxID=37637 RepID=A0AAP4F8T0_9CORY|nr:ATP-binding protein [Corynebacterium pseudodiphtheriticum]MDK4228573.1 ATP-binding protein [Corynebacterium pseudodiphtheriticum]MDK4306555.1 ATP-binding protein [Corynebacterium pseudodiphtheriticum]MDK8396162.1 ATP-binding protein [Corynebacterium pseudodiphtheriticum]
MQESPYTPSSIARDLVGREQQLRRAQMMLTSVSSNKLAEELQIYVGPRGVGKTSLLRSIQSAAQSQSFETVWVTAGDGVVIDELVSGIEKLLNNHARQVSTALWDMIKNIKVSIAGVSVSGPGSSELKTANMGPSSHSLGRQLQDILIAVGKDLQGTEKSAGLGIFVDEIQLADGPSIRALAYTWQHLQSEGSELPLFCLMSGLSHSQDVITEYASFGERFNYINLSNLDEASSAEALRRPAEKMGVKWTPSALLDAANTAAGYPYFLQLIGECSWEAAGLPEPGGVISPEVLVQAKSIFHNRLQQFYRSRWMKASESEQEIMAAMAQYGDEPVRRGSIAQELGKPSSALSMQRQSLMDKGLVESTGWGMMSFTAPGFGDFIRKLIGADE